MGFSGDSDTKESACNEGDPGLNPGLRRYTGKGNQFSSVAQSCLTLRPHGLQHTMDCSMEKGMATHYSCLENSMDREDWRATVCGVTKSQT